MGWCSLQIQNRIKGKVIYGMKREAKLIGAIILLVGSVLNTSLLFLIAQMERQFDARVDLYFEDALKYINGSLIAVTGVMFFSGLMMLLHVLLSKKHDTGDK